MYKQEQINPYHAGGDKSEQVEQMFDRIAPSYDTLNHRLSWNIDKRWRRKAISKLIPYHPQRMLDIATGTGDFAILSAKMLKPKKLLAVDISEGMMQIGQEKVEKSGLRDVISFQREDCLSLSFSDDSFDAITAAFGKDYYEMNARRLVTTWGGDLNDYSCRNWAGLLSGYYMNRWLTYFNYLTATIEAFPQGDQMIDILHHAGFSQAVFKRYTFGICTMYFATK